MAGALLRCLFTLCTVSPWFLGGAVPSHDDDLGLLQVHSEVREKTGALKGQAPASVAALAALKRDHQNTELIRAALRWPQPGDPNAQPSQSQIDTIEALKQHPHDMKLINESISGLAVTPVWYVIQEGGYDILFGALREFADEPTVQMNAWRGLSDQSHTELGSGYINNYGGPNEGIKYMVEELKAHPTPYEAECADHLTYQYEVLQCICGLVKWDVDGTRSAAAVEAGLADQLVHVLTVEFDRRASVDVACRVAVFLLQHNNDHAESRLRELGARALILQAIARFPAYDPTPFYFGSTVGEHYPVRPSCLPALMYL